MPNKELMFRGRRLHYKIEGSGTPVVLIHGFAEDHSIWRYQIEALSKKHQIITPDIPGSGKSEAMEDEEINIEDFAEAIDKVIEAEKIDQFILMGHSMGGYISLAYLEMFPEKIKALGLIHSTSFADSETKKQNRKKSIEFIKNNGSEPFLKTIIPDLYFDKIEENTNIETPHWKKYSSKKRYTKSLRKNMKLGRK